MLPSHLIPSTLPRLPRPPPPPHPNPYTTPPAPRTPCNEQVNKCTANSGNNKDFICINTLGGSDNRKMKKIIYEQKIGNDLQELKNTDEERSTYRRKSWLKRNAATFFSDGGCKLDGRDRLK